jgi:3-oxoacid CoA-transferase subunit A
MIYLTGDTHRDFWRVRDFCERFNTTKEDILIILGDAGINYLGDSHDYLLKKTLSKIPVTLFCIHGNHEMRPEKCEGYKETGWYGGTVYTQPKYPSIIFAKDGEIYELNGKRCIAIGGAYSVDKYLRLDRGWSWWNDEQPSAEIKQQVEQKLTTVNWKVDAVLSHTCPMKYIPREAFLKGIDNSTVDNSTEQWLDTVDDILTYNNWYCGHYHISKSIDKIRFMFDDFVSLEDSNFNVQES